MILGMLATLSATASDPLLAGGLEAPEVFEGLEPIAITPPGDLGGGTGIVNGTVDSSNTYDNVVLLALYDGNYFAGFCSGTLIHARWVLTAAHCLSDLQTWPGADPYVFLGSGQGGSFNDFVGWANSYIHPSYDGTQQQIGSDEDVGLVELARAVNGVTPAVLNDEPPDGTWLGEEILFVGYGITSDGAYDSGTKRYADIAMFDWDTYNIYSDDPQQNVCQGDSGGAAFEQTPQGLELTGVNSFVFPSCVGGSNGAARVDQYIGWIQGYVPNVALDPGDGTGGTTGGTGTGTGDPEPVDTGIEVDEIERDYEEWNEPGRPVKGMYSACSTGPAPSGLGGALFVALLLVARRPRPS